MMDLVISRLHNIIELGGPVVMILACMSVLALAIAIWKAIVFELEGVGYGLRRGFVRTTLDELHIGTQEVSDLRERIYARLDTGFGRVSSGLRILDLTAQIAPLLGLFGTVLGMIDAFRTLQEAGSSADPSILAGGIWVALMTTAAGLVVAMPSSLVLSWFDGRLEAHRRAATEAVEQRLTPRAFAGQEDLGHALPA